jgi:hypothetical protein
MEIIKGKRPEGHDLLLTSDEKSLMKKHLKTWRASSFFAG